MIIKRQLSSLAKYRVVGVIWSAAASLPRSKSRLCNIMRDLVMQKDYSSPRARVLRFVTLFL